LIYNKNKYFCIDEVRVLTIKNTFSLDIQCGTGNV